MGPDTCLVAGPMAIVEYSWHTTHFSKQNGRQNPVRTAATRTEGDGEAAGAEGGEAATRAAEQDDSQLFTSTRAPGSLRTNIKVGITGLACLLASEACNPARLWDVLSKGGICIVSSPPKRWHTACQQASAPSEVLFGAFVSDLEGFGGDDSAAQSLDMHMQLLYSVANEALVDASWPFNPALHLGVITATETCDFVAPTSSWMVSRDLAVRLQSEGTNMNIEAGCASGYLGMDRARKLLEEEQCNTALVTGVSLMLKPASSMALAQMGALSPSGKMRPLDIHSDGMVRGEGAVAVVLQTPGKNPYATVKGSASTITSTTSPLNADSFEIAYAAHLALSGCGVPADAVSATHMHAMGNPARDIAEAGAIWEVLGERRPSSKPLVLISHKGSFGHTIAPSGLVALVSTVLVMQNRCVPCWASNTQPVDAIKSMVLPTDFVAPLLNDSVMATTSISGTSTSGDNVHLILSEYPNGKGCVLQKLHKERSPHKTELTDANTAHADSVTENAQEVPCSGASDRLHVQELVLSRVKSLIGVDVAVEAPLMQAGLKSADAVRLSMDLQRELGPEPALPRTLVFLHPTIIAITDHIAGAAGVPTRPAAPTTTSIETTDHIAGAGVPTRPPAPTTNVEMGRKRAVDQCVTQLLAILPRAEYITDEKMMEQFMREILLALEPLPGFNPMPSHQEEYGKILFPAVQASMSMPDPAAPLKQAVESVLQLIDRLREQARQQVRQQCKAAESHRQGPCATVTGACNLSSDIVDVVAMNCMTTGASGGTPMLWSSLWCGSDTLSTPPISRCDLDPPVLAGHFVPGAEQFDSHCFSMNPVEVQVTDPCQRMLLEVALGGLVGSGHHRNTLFEADVGVFVGFGQNPWTAVQQKMAPNVFTSHGLFASAGAGRISYTLGLRGPCLAVDTACSSSLVALDIAHKSLHLGACESAVAAGVSICPHSSFWVYTGPPLAPDGRCKTFDSSADGYGRGEGCFLVVLQCRARQPLVQLSDIAVNQDGKSANFSAPSGPSQVRVIRAALKQRAVEQHTSETHGTGTELGDAIEMEMVKTVLGSAPRAAPFIPGAVKTLIGHTEYGAGQGSDITV